MNRKQRRANKNNQYEFKTMPCESAFILNVHISKDDLKKVQSYSREMFDADASEKIDASYDLVGEIPNGEELQVDPDDIRIKQFCETMRVVAKKYIDEYARRIRRDINITGLVHDKIWLNSYEKGDYNPYHDHGTNSTMGLSWFLYVKVPEDMNSRSANEGKAYEGALGGGKFHNGCTALHWGYNYHDASTSFNSFLIPQMAIINPEEGSLYMFPKWLKHQVYPHTCDERRVSMAGNISVY